jgi:hypothetical protein
MGGLTLGGGYGMLARAFGLLCTQGYNYNSGGGGGGGGGGVPSQFLPSGSHPHPI